MRHSKRYQKVVINKRTILKHFGINYSISFEVLFTADDDDENDSKSKKSENTINE